MCESRALTEHVHCQACLPWVPASPYFLTEAGRLLGRADSTCLGSSRLAAASPLICRDAGLLGVTLCS